MSVKGRLIVNGNADGEVTLYFLDHVGCVPGPAYIRGKSKLLKQACAAGQAKLTILGKSFQLNRSLWRKRLQP